MNVFRRSIPALLALVALGGCPHAHVPPDAGAPARHDGGATPTPPDLALVPPAGAADLAVAPAPGSDAGGDGGAVTPPPTTPLGTPLGPPSLATIGAAGGSLSSFDGRARVIIPAGALATDTMIRIQPITNEAPNGMGLAYDLQPDGLVFARPATLVLTYTSADLDGTAADQLGVAVQDAQQRWQAELGGTLDPNARTLTLPLPHFSAHAPYAGCTINGKRAVLIGKSITSAVICVAPPGTVPINPSDPDPPYLGPIATIGSYSWSFAGDGTFGVEPDPSRADYIADGGAKSGSVATLTCKVQISQASNGALLAQGSYAHQVRVVGKRWTLSVVTEDSTSCGDTWGPVVSFDRKGATAAITFDVADDLGVTDEGPGFTGLVTLTGPQSCVPGGSISNVMVGPGNIITSASGHLDAQLGYFILNLDGTRTTFPGFVLSAGGQMSTFTVDTHKLLVVPLGIRAEDGAVQTFSGVQVNVHDATTWSLTAS